MECPPQNPEFMINPENVHPCFMFKTRGPEGPEALT